jgi:hypothetical protein
VERGIARGEQPAASDVGLLAMLPVTLLQNWRQTYEYSPDDTVIERIVIQFFTPAPRRAPLGKAPHLAMGQAIGSAQLLAEGGGS